MVVKLHRPTTDTNRPRIGLSNLLRTRCIVAVGVVVVGALSALFMLGSPKLIQLTSDLLPRIEQYETQDRWAFANYVEIECGRDIFPIRLKFIKTNKDTYSYQFWINLVIKLINSNVSNSFSVQLIVESISISWTCSIFKYIQVQNYNHSPHACMSWFIQLVSSEIKSNKHIIKTISQSPGNNLITIAHMNHYDIISYILHSVKTVTPLTSRR